MDISNKLEKYLNERKTGTQSPKKLADQLSAQIENSVRDTVEFWRKETFGDLGETEYKTQLDEVFAITAKRMLTFFKGMKRGAQNTLRRR